MLFLPETAVLTASMAMLSLSLLKNEASERLTTGFLYASAFAAVTASAFAVGAEGSLFHGTYRVDLFSQGFKLLIALAFLGTVLLSEKSPSLPRSRRVEYGFFLGSATLGMMLM